MLVLWHVVRLLLVQHAREEDAKRRRAHVKNPLSFCSYTSPNPSLDTLIKSRFLYTRSLALCVERRSVTLLLFLASLESRARARKTANAVREERRVSTYISSTRSAEMLGKGKTPSFSSSATETSIPLW